MKYLWLAVCVLNLLHAVVVIAAWVGGDAPQAQPHWQAINDDIVIGFLAAFAATHQEDR